jgi:hypothetical protein
LPFSTSSSSSQQVPSVSQTLGLPQGCYVVPRQVQTTAADNLAPGLVLFEARVPAGISGPGKKSPGKLCIQLTPDAGNFWAARICNRTVCFYLAVGLVRFVEAEMVRGIINFIYRAPAQSCQGTSL